MSQDIATAVRPAMRGYIHLTVALLSPFALLHLLIIAGSPAAYVSGAVFGASLILLYAASAARHLIAWPPRALSAARRLDHSMAFVLIGGSYTPFALKAMSLGWGISVLSVVWGLAGSGILLTVAWPRAPRPARVGVYLACGWVALAAVAELSNTLPRVAFVLTVAGGVFYSAGAVIFLMRRPNPFPRVFGYHEIFHTLVVAATAMFYFVVVVYVMPL